MVDADKVWTVRDVMIEDVVSVSPGGALTTHNAGLVCTHQSSKPVSGAGWFRWRALFELRNYEQSCSRKINSSWPGAEYSSTTSSRL